jgi:hypothetical protein
MGKPLPVHAPTFDDNADISPWAFDAVGQMQAAGIMGGVGDNRFAPQGDYTREQSIITMLRLFAETAGAPVQTPPPAQVSPGDSIAAGSTIDFGGITWSVLEIRDGRALLLSESVLEQRAYHGTREPITWENSAIRRYLNNEFINARFTADERVRIAETSIANDDNPRYVRALGGNNTVDRVFLLSIDEAVRYFGDSGVLQDVKAGFRTDQIDDRYNSARIALDEGGRARWWILRSPGGTTSRAARVASNGNLRFIGNYVENSDAGIRPALWLDLES